MSQIAQRVPIIVSLIVITVYLLPLLVLGERAHVTIHDNLDSTFVSMKVLAEGGNIFAAPSAKIDDDPLSLPRASFPSELNLTLWFFYLFGPFAAYVIGDVFLRLVAFFGMYRLLRRYILKRDKDILIVSGVALCFALMHFYVIMGLTIAGLPLVLYSFLNIRCHRSDWKDWLVIAAVPFHSMFVLSYVFLLIALAGLWIHDWLRYREANLVFAGAIAFAWGMFAIVEYRMLLAFLSPSIGFISHRVEFAAFSAPTLANSLKEAAWIFFVGQYHARATHTAIILPTVAIALSAILTRRVRVPYFLPIFLAIGAISFWYGFWPFVVDAIKSVAAGLPVFNLSRFYFLSPFLWYVLFALALTMFWDYGRIFKIMVVAALVGQVALLISRNDHFVGRSAGDPSYAEFFSTGLYEDIDLFIGRRKDTYRVASIGMYPSIAEYNGFRTLDGYFPTYPLSYKHKFREIIAGELEKNSQIRTYFDKWGSRFYIFVSELDRVRPYSFMLTKERVRDHHISIERLAFNTGAFKQMGGEYIFSTVEVRNSSEIGLRFLKLFKRNDSPWEIYVYQAI